MQFRVLGSLEVRRGDDLVDIGSSNERRILAALLVNANAVVGASRLIEVVWGDQPPASARNALQTYVARLRRRLRTDATPAAIVTRPPGYAIELGPHQLDSLEFRELVVQGRASLGRDPATALELLDDALKLWRGPAFAEFADDDVARAEAMSLEELHQSAIEERVEALLALGRSPEAVSVLEGVVADQPLRERPHAQLMRALARSGRQVEALRLYQRFRERLAEELGLEPSSFLRDVEGQILAQAARMTPPASPPLPSPATHGNIAPAITTFVGREEDVAGLVDLLGRARVVTLLGVGGVGKSRLAVRLAETVEPGFPDGAWVAELARLNEADAVPHAVAAALGIVLPAGSEPSGALVDVLRPRRMLLVVDNCEHVLEAVSRLVESLVRRCPSVTVVATSRERLAVGGEHIWPVLPLPVPPVAASEAEVEASPAVALFLDRVHAARADFELQAANTGAVVEICRGLDGLPLALELAAARLGVLTAQDLAQRLRDRFALLTAGPRGEGERHRTLRALVDWSYGLLDDAERRVFDRLSVFAGGWTLEAAAAVCADGVVSASEVPGVVAGLAEKSMVVPPVPSGPGRYGMLETLRLYGSERLEARAEREATSDAHARHFLALAEEAEVELRGPHEGAWVKRLRAEIDNLRTAHAWSRTRNDPDIALRLSVALHRFACWQANDEILSWAEASAELPSAEGHRLHPVVLGSAAIRRMHRGEMDAATRFVERALTSCGGIDDLRRALPTEALGSVCLLSGRLEEAFDHYGEALHLWRLRGDDQAAVWCLCSQGVSMGKRGDLASAFGLTRDARQLAASGNPTIMAMILYAEGESLLEVDPVRALDPIAEALEFAEAAGNVFMAGLARVSNTSLRGRHGDPLVALRLFEDVLRHWQGGRHSQLWISLRNLVELLARLGVHEPASVLYGACLESSPPSYGAEADRLEAVLATLIASRGEEAFAEAKARGEAFNYDEALSFASEVIRRLLAEAADPIASA